MTSTLDILVRARDQASSTITKVSGAGRRLDSTMTNTGKSTSRLGGIMSSTVGKLAVFGGGIFAAKKLLDFGSSAIHAAEDAHRSVSAFDAALQRTGQTANINETKFNSWLQTMGEGIGQDDEDLRDLATTVASAFDFHKLSGDATHWLELTTRGIQDVAAATQKSPGLIKRMFMSLLNDPAAATGQLKKLGVITTEQAAHFKKMAAAGNEAGATQEMLTLVTSKYAGAAAANTTPSAKLAAIWENMKESLGNFLLPLFTSFVDNVSRGVAWFRDFSDAVRGGKTNLGGFGVAVHIVGAAFKFMWDALVQGLELLGKFFGWLMGGGAIADAFRKAIMVLALVIGGIFVYNLVIAGLAALAFGVAAAAAWVMASGGLILVVAAVIAVGVAIYELVKHWRGAWNAIKHVVLTAWNFMKRIVTTGWHAIYKVLNFTPIIALVKLGWKAVQIYFRVAWAIIKGYVAVGNATVKTVIKVGMFVIRDVILPILHTIQNAWHTAWSVMKSVFSGVWGALVAVATPVVNALIGMLNSLINAINMVIHGYNLIPGHGDIGEIPPIPTLATGGLVTRTGLAIVDRGETFSGIGGGRGQMTVVLDRRRFVDSDDFHVKFRGF